MAVRMTTATARPVPRSVAALLAELELLAPETVDRALVRRLLEAADDPAAAAPGRVDVVIDQLRRAGWLLPLRTRGCGSSRRRRVLGRTAPGIRSRSSGPTSVAIPTTRRLSRWSPPRSGGASRNIRPLGMSSPPGPRCVVMERWGRTAWSRLTSDQEHLPRSTPCQRTPWRRCWCRWPSSQVATGTGPTSGCG